MSFVVYHLSFDDIIRTFFKINPVSYICLWLRKIGKQQFLSTPLLPTLNYHPPIIPTHTRKPPSGRRKFKNICNEFSSLFANRRSENISWRPVVIVVCCFIFVAARGPSAFSSYLQKAQVPSIKRNRRGRSLQSG